MEGMELLVNSTNRNKPSDWDYILYLFAKKGITPKQLREEFTIPEILSIINTEVYVKQKQNKKMK
jgi:hypothetical protein